MKALPRIAAVIGSGTMGPGIAATLARAGTAVRLYDISEQAIENARANYELVKGVLAHVGTPEAVGGEVTFGTDLAEAVADADLIIEAIPERIELKTSLLKQLEALVEEGVIIATNTSGIPITTMAESMTHPGRLIGMHWSNPPHLIPMIEVIPGKQTDAVLVDRMVEIVKSFDYVPVVEKETPGFVENRILYAILRECIDLLEREIVTPEGLDACVKWGIGYKLSVVGPTRLLDMAGLDIYHAVSSYLNADLADRKDVPQLVLDKIQAGTLGFKSGAGMYEYDGPEAVAEKRGEIIEGLIATRKTLSSIPIV